MAAQMPNSCTMPSKKAGSRFTGFFVPGLMYIGQRSQLLWHCCSSCTCPAAVATKTRYPPAGMLQPCPHRLLQMCPGLSAEEHLRSACLCTDSRTELLPCVNTRMRTTLDSVFTHLCYVLLSTKSVNDDKGSWPPEQKRKQTNNKTSTKKYNQARCGTSGL